MRGDEMSGTALAAGVHIRILKYSYRWLAPFRSVTKSSRFDAEQWLAESNCFAVLNENFDDATGLLRLDFIEHLHRFDHADRRVWLDHGADRNKRCVFRTGCRVERADCRSVLRVRSSEDDDPRSRRASQSDGRAGPSL